ncbi:MAG: hypothetical protein RIQ82_1332, partial [Bacteroidota bacterium]
MQTIMRSIKLSLCTLAFLAVGLLSAQNKAVPVFKEGLAQIVEEFSDQNEWIRHDLWVETEFDSDLDGQ